MPLLPGIAVSDWRIAIFRDSPPRCIKGFEKSGLVLSTTTSPARAGDAEEFVRTTGERAFTSLAGDITGRQPTQLFRELLNDSFDLTTIARFTLGRYWRLASPTQRTEYRRLFEEFLVQAYANRFSGLSGKQFRVSRSRAINARDALVQSEVLIAHGRPPVRVGWRVRTKNDDLRIIDVMVEGISMSVTQRDEFAAVIRSSGGKVEGLLAALRRKTGFN